MSPSSSGLDSKPNKKQAWSRLQAKLCFLLVPCLADFRAEGRGDMSFETSVGGFLRRCQYVDYIVSNCRMIEERKGFGRKDRDIIGVLFLEGLLKTTKSLSQDKFELSTV
jgi:hypothetical protein